jgi:zinc-ribbon domain
MFCPKCGVKNLEDAKFCRACGADIRLVPQALAGSLTKSAPAELVERKKKKSKRDEPPTLEKGFETIFGGLAFLILFMLGFFYFKGFFWIWVWFIFPGLEHLGRGIGQVIRSRREPRALAPSSHDGDALPGYTPAALQGPATSEIAPPSVTESTTRNLGAPAPRAARNAH